MFRKSVSHQHLACACRAISRASCAPTGGRSGVPTMRCSWQTSATAPRPHGFAPRAPSGYAGGCVCAAIAAVSARARALGTNGLVSRNVLPYQL